MQDMTLEQIIAAHNAIMAKDGGDCRVLSEGGLHQLVFRANLVEDPCQRAALVFYSLCAFPAFREGNRRTAGSLAETILADGGFRGRLPCGELRSLARGIDAFLVETEDVEQVLHRYFRTTP
jgi:hypothetical protein